MPRCHYDNIFINTRPLKSQLITACDHNTGGGGGGGEVIKTTIAGDDGYGIITVVILPALLPDAGGVVNLKFFMCLLYIVCRNDGT